MEGLAALGLVANIIQVVDAAANAFNVCREIYSLGSSIEDSRMENTNKELLQSYSVLVGKYKSVMKCYNALRVYDSVFPRAYTGVSIDTVLRIAC